MAKRIFSKDSISSQDKLRDLLSNTDEVDGCMVWKRALNTDGYPTMLGNVKVHRLVCELHSGEDITGYVVRHTCDNPRCINPDHLLKGTVRDNIRDMDSRGRRYKTMTRATIQRTKQLLQSKLLLHTEIAQIVGIDVRRVSDINCDRYNDDATIKRKR